MAKPRSMMVTFLPGILSPRGRMLAHVTVYFWAFYWGSLLGAQVTTGAISGTVRDQSGAVIPGVTVTVSHVDTGLARTVQSDAQGRYRAPELPLGNYEVQTELAGFQTAVRRGIELTVGREAVVDFSLSVGAVAEKMVVTGEAPLVDTISGSMAGLVTEERIKELPLNGRDLTQLTTLEPGVSYVHRGGSDSQGGFGKRLSIAGARPDMVGWSLDGTDIQTASKTGPSGAAGVQLGVESVREFQILTNSYTAEYGGYAGGAVNAITKSGTNELHGSVFEFLRNSDLDARNFFDPGSSPPQFKRNQFGASLGGHILKDRTFFFGAYEGLRERLGVTQTGSVPTAQARQGILPGQAQVAVNAGIVPILALFPLPNGRNLNNGTAQFLNATSRPTDENNFTVRVDHSFNAKNFLFGRYTFDDANVTDVDAISLISPLTRSRHQYVTVEETSIFSPRWLNKIRAGYNRSFDSNNYQALRDITPLKLIPRVYPANFTVPTLAVLGLAVTTPRLFIPNSYELADDASFSSGRQNLKFGLVARHTRLFMNQESRAGGRWTFNSLADFLTGTVNAFDAPMPGADSARNWRQQLYGFYVQDNWTVSPRWTVNLGLRYEFITEPSEINGKSTAVRHALDPVGTIGPLFANPSLHNFAPRVGFAWNPLGDGKTSVRGGFGVFFDQLLSSYWKDQSVRQPPFFNRGTLNRAALQNVPVANTYQTLLSQAQISYDLTSMEYNISTPYIMQYNVNVQRQVTGTLMATVGFVGSRGVHLFRAEEGDSAIPQILPDGTKFFPTGLKVRNPVYGSDRRSVSDALSRYNGLLLGLRKRLAHGLQLQASYTRARSIDEASTLFSATLAGQFNSIDPDNHRRNRGLSLFDIRNVFVANSLWEFPWGRNFTGLKGKLLRGWEIAGILTLQSGTPDTPALSFNQSRNLATRNLFEVPNLKPGASNNPVLGGPDKYFDPTVFTLQPAGFFGNLGRNTLIGPGLATVDFSLFKETYVPSVSETFKVQFRAEFFNLLNRPNFNNPDVSAIVQPNGAPNLGAATIGAPTATSSRQIQFALKVVF